MVTLANVFEVNSLMLSQFLFCFNATDGLYKKGFKNFKTTGLHSHRAPTKLNNGALTCFQNKEFAEILTK